MDQRVSILKTHTIMTASNSSTLNLNLSNSYLRLFQIAQQNLQLWQQEEKIRRIKKRLKSNVSG